MLSPSVRNKACINIYGASMTLTRREFILSMSGCTALIAASGQTAHGVISSDQYCIAGNILVGDGSAPLKNHALLINGDTIEAILPRHEIKEHVVIETPDSTILPGIINCHCHRIHSSQERRERYLLHGVTSIGDTASPIANIPSLLDSPSGMTATAACAGPMLCPPGGYPLPVHSADHAMVVESPTKGRDAVRRLHDLGVTMIKLAFEPGINAKAWPMFDPDTAHAICDEARKRGLITRCHVEDFAGLEPALNAGVHTIEHVPYRWTPDGEPQKIIRNGELIPQYRKQMDRMKQDGIILTPTLDVFSRSMWEGEPLYKPVRYFNAIGGKIALGNDHPYRRTEAGMPYREIEFLGKAGLSPAQIIMAGTQNSGTVCGFSDRGTLAPGMKADLLVVKGDPLKDLSNLNNPLRVIKDGIQVR